MGDSFIYMHPVYIHVYLGVVGGWVVGGGFRLGCGQVPGES